VSKIGLELKYIGNGIFQAADVEYCESVLKPNDEAIFRYVRWTANKARTLRQNAALHKYFVKLAHALNDAGLDLHHSFFREIELQWNEKMVKDKLWRKIQIAVTEKESTAKLDRKEVDEVYRLIDRKMLEQGVNVAFPSVSNHGLD